MDKPICTYQLRAISIWGNYFLRRSPYYSLDQTVYALKRRIMMNDLFRERYQTGQIVLELVHFVDHVEVAKQSINFKIN